LKFFRVMLRRASSVGGNLGPPTSFVPLQFEVMS